jgi:hypothetical protein
MAETKGYYAQGARTLYSHDLLALSIKTCVVNVCGISI